MIMRRIINLVFTVIACLATTPVLAEPITHPVKFICPNPTDLGYFGSYVAGLGTEILSPSITNIIYFKSTDVLYNVPSSLANYTNEGTNYDGPSGTVSCLFKSSDSSEGDFSISYEVTNGKGGNILTQTKKAIRVLFFVGLK
jgi:hypothetical protein